jgi:hypothetical protein
MWTRPAKTARRSGNADAANAADGVHLPANQRTDLPESHLPAQRDQDAMTDYLTVTTPEDAYTLAEAAAKLRMSKRWLEQWLAKHPVDAAGNPFYVPMGRKKTFEPADIARIRESIRGEERCRLNSIGLTIIRSLMT